MSALVSPLPDAGAVSALPGAAAPSAGEALADGSAIALYAHPSADYAAKLEHTLALLRAAAPSMPAASSRPPASAPRTW